MTALPTTVRLADPFPLGYVPPPRFDRERDHAKTVRRVREIVRLSGLVPFFEDALRKRTGRPVAGLSVEGILVALLGTACERQPMLVTEFCDFLHHRTGDRDRADMGVTRPRPFQAEAHSPDTDKDRARREQEAAESQFRKRLRAMLDLVDPSPHRSKGRILDREIFNQAEQSMTPEQTEQKRRELDWVCNRLLEATWLSLPRAVRRSWNGSLAIDATFVGTWARGTGNKSPRTSADPDAAWWQRHDDHYVPDPDKVGLKAVDAEGNRIYKYGHESEFAITGPDRPEDADAFPRLVLAMTLHRPGHGPAKHAVDLLASIRTRHLHHDPRTGAPLDYAHPDGDDARQHPAGWLATDRAYSDGTWDKFALPVRALGYRPVFDYKENAYGLQAEHKGMVLVEGRWYSPSITTQLVEATIDRKVRHVIDGETYRSRIKAREAYAMRYRGQGTDIGDARWVCPAEGTVGTRKPPVAACEHKEPSLVLLGMPGNTRPKVKPSPVADEIPEVCRTREVLALNNVHIKHQQDLPYESEKWKRVYNSLRNTVEGVNGTAKSGAVTGIDLTGARRSTGLAATSLFVACLVAAENLRKIVAFYDKATWNPDGTMTDHTPVKPRKPRRKAPWMRDWLPDRATPEELAAAALRPQANLPAPSTATKAKTRAATAGKATDPAGTKRANHRAKRAGPPGRT